VRQVLEQVEVPAEAVLAAQGKRGD